MRGRKIDSYNPKLKELARALRNRSTLAAQQSEHIDRRDMVEC